MEHMDSMQPVTLCSVKAIRTILLATIGLLGQVQPAPCHGPEPVYAEDIDASWVSWLCFSPDGQYLGLRRRATEDLDLISAWKCSDWKRSGPDIRLEKQSASLPMADRFVMDEGRVILADKGHLETLSLDLKRLSRDQLEVGIRLGHRVRHAVDRADMGRRFWMQTVIGDKRLTIADVLLDSGKPAKLNKMVFDESTDLITATAVSRDGKIVVIGTRTDSKRSGDKYALEVWDLEKGKKRFTRFGHDDLIKTISVSGDGRLFASGGADGKLFLWDASDGTVKYAAVEEYSISSIRFVDGTDRLFYTTYCRAPATNLKFVSVRAKKAVAQASIGPEGLEIAALSADGKLLATCSGKRLCVWETARLLPTLAEPPGK